MSKTSKANPFLTALVAISLLVGILGIAPPTASGAESSCPEPDLPGRRPNAEPGIKTFLDDGSDSVSLPLVRPGHGSRVVVAYFGGTIWVDTDVQVDPDDECKIQGGAGTAPEPDSGGDGMGDEWQRDWEDRAGQVLQALVDSDDDDLLNVDEFRWNLVPICVVDYGNCKDHESGLLNGTGGDNWTDGLEVLYWNNVENDLFSSGTAVAVHDPDRNIDSDGDLLANVDDRDADEDGLLDGDEARFLDSYPEFADSDCDISAAQCTPSGETSYAGPKVGSPGTRDGLPDGRELAYWFSVGPSAAFVDYDGDGIATNLLDPDSDGDTLLDGEEVDLWGSKPHLLDSDLDGLKDGEEVRVYRTNPVVWDSDGDGLPDGWEADHLLQPLANDAGLDGDADELSNLAEYRHARPTSWNEAGQGPWAGGTNPSDPDTDGDALEDGDEVLARLTDPLHWDTDRDGMPDSFEVDHGFAPRNGADAAGDADQDYFDQGQDGSIEKPWSNLDEYRYGRIQWNEAEQGPWPLGTDPLDEDSDDDMATDGMEAFYGTDARLPAQLESDEDEDGLTWADEVRFGTNPSDPDTDGDGLCDGGRAAACRFLALDTNAPGELDYSSIPWSRDSDDDGRNDDWEVQRWDPGASGTAQDVDGDRLNGVIDPDSDGDGLLDGDEYLRGTGLDVPDSDKDALLDGEEVNVHATSPLDDDSDNDGLLDGQEVQVHGTLPSLSDTDGDGLGDGREIREIGTSALLRDTDQDGLPDFWEVGKGTLPLAQDADQDVDADGLINAREYALGSLPTVPDSDDDDLPDGYEDEHQLGVVVHSASADPDGDLYVNIDEFNAGTDPRNADTDGDGRGDGWEATASRSDPLDVDTDKDGLDDGREFTEWDAKSYPWSTDPDGDTLTAFRDLDSDNDGLTDRDELLDTKTRPHDPDTDDDLLSDFDEVFTYGGQYDPNEADTDGDGQRDSVEVAFADTNGDFDRDGLPNGMEESNGTDPTLPDTDCDGVQDGPEFTFFGFGAPLHVKDWDGDSIFDGLELGTAGTPSEALYRTHPAMWDTDGDELGDEVEARNNVRVRSCDPAPSSQASSASGLQGPALVPTGPQSVAPRAPTLAPGGFFVGLDENGWYVKGGYGVRLYVNATLPPTATLQEVVDALGIDRSASTRTPAAGTNGQLTHPEKRDTDGDRLPDGKEKNLFKTNPNVCDTDGDGLGDALELGVPGSTLDPKNACTHLDSDPGTKTDPNKPDTDGDRRTDGQEDVNRNGWADATMDAWGYAPLQGEMNPVAVDTDGDGLADDDEVNGVNTKNPALTREIKTLPFSFDSDRDGLSDGLEMGVRDADKASDTLTNARTISVFGRTVSTFQPYKGTGTSLLIPYSGYGDSSSTRDFDADGIIDGLEDWTPNGLYKEGAYELDPTDRDSDDDDLSDGRELRIYGNYNFPKIMQLWNGSATHLVFDRNSLWETDPRPAPGKTYSDSDNDGVPDGDDLNPRLDGVLLKFKATGLQAKERLDNCCTSDGYFADPYFRVTANLPFLAGEYFDVKTVKVHNVHIREPTDPTLTVAEILHRPGPYAVNTLNQPNILEFELPQDVSSGVNLQSMQASFALQGWDDDARFPNVLDFDQSGSTAAVLGYSLDRDAGRSMDSAYTTWGKVESFAGDVRQRDGDEDVRITLVVGDNIPTYFLQGLRQAGTSPPTAGLCPGYDLPSCY